MEKIIHRGPDREDELADSADYPVHSSSADGSTPFYFSSNKEEEIPSMSHRLKAYVRANEKGENAALLRQD